MNKVTLPNFDGSEKITAHAWLQKLNTYFTLSPMTEEDAIQIAILHLEGLAHKWWHHGIHTQEHQNITSYEEFSQKLIKSFDRKHPQEDFKRLTQLKQQGTIESYITEFQRISVRVSGIEEDRLTYLFVERLKDSLTGLVSALNPISIEDAIEKALRLESSSASNKTPNNHKKPFHKKNEVHKTFPPRKNAGNSGKRTYATHVRNLGSMVTYAIRRKNYVMLVGKNGKGRMGTRA